MQEEPVNTWAFFEHESAGEADSFLSSSFVAEIFNKPFA
jgi:hypothetical protein